MGLLYSTASYTETINVTAVNDLPTSANGTVTATEDTQYVFTPSNFDFSDLDTGNTLQKIQVTQIETAGALKLNGVDVTLEPGDRDCRHYSWEAYV